ncbi:MAG TPA: hypothetical protein VLE91_03280 [Candidatus Saccharimonadales bacterium]|nr:hypothetical protein [Candidatus Saccharimonadales bacterium]
MNQGERYSTSDEYQRYTPSDARELTQDQAHKHIESSSLRPSSSQTMSTGGALPLIGGPSMLDSVYFKPKNSEQTAATPPQPEPLTAIQYGHRAPQTAILVKV